MKVLSVKQPWASLIIDGIKDVENRTWKCPEKYIGQRIFIHASAKPETFNSLGDIVTKEQYQSLKGTCGYIIGSVEIVDCVINHPSVWAEKTKMMRTIRFDEFILVPDGNPVYNLVLANPIKLRKPIIAIGKLRFWDYPYISDNNF
jgi:hypothetical protein